MKRHHARVIERTLHSERAPPRKMHPEQRFKIEGSVASVAASIVQPPARSARWRFIRSFRRIRCGTRALQTVRLRGDYEHRAVVGPG